MAFFCMIAVHEKKFLNQTEEQRAERKRKISDCKINSEFWGLKIAY